MSTPPPSETIIGQGSIVWLRSGSVRLTVEKITEAYQIVDGPVPPRMISVVWAKDGIVHREDFPEFVLTSARPS